MITVRSSKDRGYADHGWLKSFHTFSFAEYYDPNHIGFRTLRVINEDRIEGGTGFGAHPHRDMEIISYVIDGALEHEDSTGNKATIRPGEVQRMSAGTGVVHSEHNALEDKETHFFQIWIRPATVGGHPGYAQKSFSDQLDSGQLVLVVSGDGRDGSLPIKQDADLYIARLKKGGGAEFSLGSGRGAWVQMVSGEMLINDTELTTGDGAAVEKLDRLLFQAQADCEFLLFDLA